MEIGERRAHAFIIVMAATHLSDRFRYTKPTARLDDSQCRLETNHVPSGDEDGVGNTQTRIWKESSGPHLPGLALQKGMSTCICIN